MSVKKALNILFLSVYLLVVVGVTISMHFCGDTLTSVQVIPFDSKNDLCGCDDVAAPDDCCKTEIKSIQLNVDQLNVQTVQAASPQTQVMVWINDPTAPLYASESIQQILPTDSPPSSTPTYILQRALLI